MKFEIRNRWSGNVQFTAEIDCTEDEPASIKVGLAVRWAVKNDADLRGANLRSFKADLWMILTQNPAEVAGLATALKEGRVDGSTYEGECACLVGTIANVRGASIGEFETDSQRPAEQWFLMIREGDKPGDESGGGFAAQQALGWIEEWQALQSVAA